MTSASTFTLRNPVCPPVPNLAEGRKRLVEDALKLFPSSVPPLQQKLLRILAEDIADEDFCFFYPEMLAASAATHWEMMCAGSAQDFADIRVHTPPAGHQPYRMTIVEIASADLAFLVNSVAAEINRHNLLISLLNHPTIYVRYDESGAPADLATEPREGYSARAHIHVQIRRVMTSEDQDRLREGLGAVIGDTYLANRDWSLMREKMRAAREHLESAHTGLSVAEMSAHSAFLDYLHDNNFTMLGYREYRFVEGGAGVESQTVKGSSLGLLHDDVVPAYINESAERLPEYLQVVRRELPPVAISKTNRISTVHRQVPMDAIAVKIYDDAGAVVGEHLFLGLFTSVTYSRSVANVPYLREKMAALLESFGFIPGSHNYKTVRHILEKYPRDELFQTELPELRDMVLNIVRLSERQRIALFMRSDRFGRYVSCLVYIPRERFGTALREDMQGVLEEALGGTCVNFTTTLDDSIFARVMYVITVDRTRELSYDADVIEETLQEMGRTWPERLMSALAESVDDEEEVTRLAAGYTDAFPIGYSDRYEARRAVFDIAHLETVTETGKMVVDLYRPTGLQRSNLRLKLYSSGLSLTLSDVMPILGNMGLRALSEIPFEITPAGAEQPVWIHDFLLEREGSDGLIDLDAVKTHFEHAFLKIWNRETESDQLNRLIISAAMNWHEVAILRAYVRYMKQVRYPLGRAYVERTLVESPAIAHTLVDLFKALHRPTLEDAEREALAEACREALTKALEGVASLDQDRVLRAIATIIEATLRTNYFQRCEGGLPKQYISLKIASQDVDFLPAPRPFREIFVSSPRIEGVHLRGGRIARGGLRWSNRSEDYRTEILGLMKSQMVKNAVIVPSGSKGGFLVKNPPTEGGRKALLAEGVACYKTFIRALLDVTDNRRGKEIIPPKDVVRRDGDDPYLVVAADKGTATFSDIANGIAAQEYGFWLGDAFASGGSAGYDHKGMGITARGAWESVKMHFRALGVNTQNTPFDVVGVGDMGGDVFGNGMLLSPQIRLVGAFNHMHIFCDPDPDPAQSFAERQRLFDGVLGWDRYDEKLLSQGGRVYSRNEKVLKLTPEIRARFDIKAERITPAELIQAMLRARTDLLWFGGIGTYVKASDEDNIAVGDKANDPLRVDATELRARVTGEGANLGITQAGRVEFGLAGGRVNTDFLDNSGGVDTSDHEVNIKILLADVMSGKKADMDRAARDRLLEDMTDEVAQIVLRDNYHQSLAINVAEARADRDLRAHDAFVTVMERAEGLDRALEGLPDEEGIAARARAGRGLTRPELCVLLSYAKINLDRALLATDLPDDPEFATWLTGYFPKVLQERYGTEIARHQLRREIVSTAMAGHIINRMGPTFIHDLQDKTGASVERIARAYMIVRDALDLPRIWAELQALANDVPVMALVEAMRDIITVCERSVARLLVRAGLCSDDAGSRPDFVADLAALRKDLEDVTCTTVRRRIAARIKSARAQKLPASLARDLAALPALATGFDISCIARECGGDLRATARAYFAVGDRFSIDWLRNQARDLPAKDYWQGRATESVVDALYACQAGLTARVLADVAEQGRKAEKPVVSWVKAHPDKAAQVEPVLESLRAADVFELSMLIIAEQRLRGLYGG